jgi:hypothetical protein
VLFIFDMLCLAPTDQGCVLLSKCALGESACATRAYRVVETHGSQNVLFFHSLPKPYYDGTRGVDAGALCLGRQGHRPTAG